MTDNEQLKELKSIIRKSSELSKLGRDAEALELLDHSIAEAIRENRPLWIRRLTQHAAVISDSVGDLRRVRGYYEGCLASDPGNSLALFGLAKVLLRQGETDRAQEYASKSYDAIKTSEREVDEALAELIVKLWPNLRK
jgi:tetratricopeptide (TPR) repeat protein